MDSQFSTYSALLTLLLAISLLPSALGDEDEPERGYLEVWVASEHDDQWGHLYIGDDLIDEYLINASDEAYLLNTLELDEGEYVVTLELENEARSQKETTVESNHTSDVLMVPVFENRSPTLHEAWVTPQEGSSETEFTFEVYYRDADNDAPDYVKLRLDTAEPYYHMEKDDESDDYEDGVWYRRILTELEEGEHSYQYIASDGENFAETEWHEGPWVGNNDGEGSAILRVWSINDFDEQAGWFWIGEDHVNEYEVPYGDTLLDELEIYAGCYWVQLKLDNGARDGREFCIEDGDTLEIELRPEHEEESNHGDPWFRFVEVYTLDTDEDDKLDTVKVFWNADTENETKHIWVELLVRDDDVIDSIHDQFELHGEDPDDTHHWVWTAPENGEYHFELLVGPHGEDNATDDWGSEGIYLWAKSDSTDGKDDAEDNKISIDEPDPEVVKDWTSDSVSLNPLVHVGTPGKSITYVATILNTGTAEATFTLEAVVDQGNSSSGNWSIELAQDNVILEAGDFTTVIVTVTIPADSNSGDKLIFQIVASSEMVNAQATASLVVLNEEDNSLPGLTMATTIVALVGVGLLSSLRRRD
jgi:hypothetical protein|tara:strand:+ start:650 stop:2416 length:1767 start_codon:yes stop_codon:yes gene_type:complete